MRKTEEHAHMIKRIGYVVTVFILVSVLCCKVLPDNFRNMKTKEGKDSNIKSQQPNKR